MAGYAAAMRIERIEVRSGLVARPLASALEPTQPVHSLQVIELGGTEPGANLRQRLDETRIYFGQLTWYLFNAEGWR